MFIYKYKNSDEEIAAFQYREIDGIGYFVNMPYAHYLIFTELGGSICVNNIDSIMEKKNYNTMFCDFSDISEPKVSIRYPTMNELYRISMRMSLLKDKHWLAFKYDLLFDVISDSGFRNFIKIADD